MTRDRPQNRNLIRPAKGTRLPGAGRKKGTPNKFTRDLKEAIIQAANKANAGGLEAYLIEVAKNDPRTFVQLLGKILPLQLEASGTVTLEALVLEAARRRTERDARLTLPVLPPL